MRSPALQWLDARLAAEAALARARFAPSLEELRGNFISDRMVDALLEGEPATVPVALPLGPLGMVGVRLGLAPDQEAALLVVLAPDLDARYATIFAYLNDDVRRRWATPELVGRLLGLPALPFFAPDAALPARGLIASASDAEAALPLRVRGWRASAPFVHRMLALPGQHIENLSRLPVQPATPGAIRLGPGAPVLLIEGAPGSGRRALAGAHAAANGRGALVLTPRNAEDMADALLAAALDHALLVIDGDQDSVPLPERDDAPIAIVTRSAVRWRAAIAPRLCVTVTIPGPDRAARRVLWASALKAAQLPAPRAAVRAVSDRFQLDPAGIKRAVDRLAMVPGAEAIDARILAAARLEASADPGPLARRVASVCSWDDLVLPRGAHQQLRDFAAAIANRERVFETWGFANVGRAVGSGLAALFAGVSGTGKTMSASVVANALGVDLWRVDLSSLVSKYIGETEKNLEKIFSCAGVSDAILFFDEAEAIFGKRSEVKDAHDRYANIETAYLLQRLEEHDGVVILATNLSRNIDAAFLRRIPFVIEFPMPDPNARARLWRKAIPQAAPLHAEVNLAEVGARFELSGGEIRAAALEAGFLAVGHKRGIDDTALATAITRQMMKRGMLPAAARANGSKL